MRAPSPLSRAQEDMLQWFLDASFGHPARFANKELAIRVLVLNFASIHTTSNSLAHALYHLAARPEWADPLRAEAADVLGAGAWTKAAMARLVRMDSFLRESARVSTLNGRACSAHVLLAADARA
jgi:cytochrome P450